MPGYKIPESVLVVIYRDDGQVLLMRRTAPAPEGRGVLAVGDGQQGP